MIHFTFMVLCIAFWCYVALEAWNVLVYFMQRPLRAIRQALTWLHKPVF